jgi:lipopolysaccharide transport system ATP-binding protein
MFKSENMIKFFIDNKTLQRIPLYNIFSNFINIRYSRKLLNNVVELGDYSINRGTIIAASEKHKVQIGKFCSIANGVSIILSSAHRADWISTYPFVHLESSFIQVHLKDNIKRNNLSSKGNIIIGNDVWIGQNAIIMSGINIGDGAVIGAGSVVTKNVENYEVVAGNPAKHIKYRFKESEVNALKKIKWWNWPIDKIMDNRSMIESSDIKKFIDKYNTNG